MSLTSVELRCPVDARALLGKVIADGDKPVVSGNLMELACRVCTKNGREFDASVVRVLHRFDLLGDLVESVVERS
jgi:hypothetical protein